MAWKAIFLISALMANPSLALPRANLSPRAERTASTLPVASSQPSSSLLEKLQDPKIEVVNMGSISEAEIEKLSSDAGLLSKRQSNSSDAQGAFADIPTLYGDFESDGERFSVDGPFSSIEFFVGDKAVRGLVLKNLDGNETRIGTAENSKNAKRPGSFEFDEDEVVTDCRIIWKKHFFGGDKYITGFQFGTNKKNQYNATSKSGGREIEEKVVGSGYPVRFHGILKKINQEPDATTAIVALGVEYLDEVRSIEMVTADYEGFEDGVQSIPSDGGKNLILGTQILDNRNSTINQTFHLTNTKAVAKTYAFTFSISFMTGATVTLGAKFQTPFVKITEATAEVSARWELTVTASTTLTYSETISQGTVFMLTCPALKFCEGKSVFQTYDLEVPFNGVFQATTRRGDKFGWNRKGVYKSSDVSNMKLQVNVYDGPPTANVGTRRI
ncbi:hypothetical protein H072_2013 [Dactylellina haptotyla CBS 200.50]|uniref:Jacalin-type lectin domain-containing protein n=1 Tax=Dactylellina haptotyla (strain CBS 200.50) TaxID=1284197 RepID=S8ASM6_DACHA|nr:hypothetical protein H072_2013 [Dactylellina haptotyla CBS 200.50]